jgi:hypothetical protein
VVTKAEYAALFANINPNDPVAQSVHMFDYVDMDHDGLFRKSEWPVTFHHIDTNSKLKDESTAETAWHSTFHIM